jgi:hypothetical protein
MQSAAAFVDGSWAEGQRCECSDWPQCCCAAQQVLSQHLWLELLLGGKVDIDIGVCVYVNVGCVLCACKFLPYQAAAHDVDTPTT